ncbi:MAG: hypothetical protein ACR2NV_06710 [Thermoleophilaceae bacterium]
MLLALLVLGLVAAALLTPSLLRASVARRTRRADDRRRASRRRSEQFEPGDPGRERRAEQRARELLRTCVNDEEWGMYRDLGFIRVPGRLVGAGRERPAGEGAGTGTTSPRSDGDVVNGSRPGGGEPPGRVQPPYAYLIYPHKPIVAYVPESRRLLSEYCVEFPDLTGAISETRLPDSDDVLAKWMAVTGDEARLLRSANMHLPGRQVDPARVRRDLWRLAEWERQRGDSSSVETPPR